VPVFQGSVITAASLAAGWTYHRCSQGFGSWLGIISQPAARARARKALVSCTFGQIVPTTLTFAVEQGTKECAGRSP